MLGPTQLRKGDESAVGRTTYVQIVTFEDDTATRTEVYTDLQRARAAAGLDPA